MLYKFKSKAGADVIMLQPNAQRLLQLIDKDSVTGILQPAEMAAALSALQAAIAHEEAQHQQAASDAAERGEEPEHLQAVSLRQRFTPFIELLQRSQKLDVPIVWGV